MHSLPKMGLVDRNRRAMNAGAQPGNQEQILRCETMRELARHARLAPHVGTGTFIVDGGAVTGRVEFLLPVDGPPIVAFQTLAKLVDTVASDLRLVGESEGGTFRLESPLCLTRRSLAGSDAGWSLVSPINGPVQIVYAAAGPAAQLRVVLNNFDYEIGDGVGTVSGGFTREGTPIGVQLANRHGEFYRRHDYEAVRPLVRAGVLRTASLTELRTVAQNESDEQLLAFANDVAGLCTFARGASVSAAMVEILDADTRPVRRLVTQPVGSRY